GKVAYELRVPVPGIRAAQDPRGRRAPRRGRGLAPARRRRPRAGVRVLRAESPGSPRGEAGGGGEVRGPGHGRCRPGRPGDRPVAVPEGPGPVDAGPAPGRPAGLAAV